MDANLQLRCPHKRESIKSALIEMIGVQGLSAGERIPGQNELARYFDTTVVTIHRALHELEAGGVLHRIGRKGTFVGPAPEATTAVRTACLILPGRDLDQPDANPDFWPYVRQLMHAFHDTLSAPWRFTTLAVPPGTRPEAVADELAHDDAVFFHHTKEPYDLLRYLVDNQVAPVVAFGLPMPGLHCFTIDHNIIEGVRQSVSYLVALGYRRIAYVGAEEAWGTPWFEGYRQGLADFGLPTDATREVKVGPWTQAEGARAAAILLQRGLPCDAIMVDSDMRALGLLGHLSHEGVRIPQDVGIMSYDGLENVTRQPPFLTSFSKPLDRMIRAGIEVASLAQSRATPERHVKLLGEVVPGQTVMKLATE